MHNVRVEQFAALTALPRVTHGFITRVAGIDVRHDKAEALRRLDSVHRAVRHEHGIGNLPFITANQVHGHDVAIIDGEIRGDRCFADYDGLITNCRDICLGIYVADCCAVYLVDANRGVIGLVHSGRKGTEFGIVSNAIEIMTQRFASDPADITVQLSPCIRPPHYEVDFAAEIVRSAYAAGVKQVLDADKCTACDLDSYYSYRAEKAKTGRMLAFLAMTNVSPR